MTNTQPPAFTVNPCAHLLLDDVRLSRLAMELARDILPFDQVLGAYNITRDTFAQYIATSAQFQIYYREHRALWNDGASVDERVKAKAAQIVEDFLPEADNILHNEQLGVGVKTNLLKEVIKLAGYSEEGRALNGGSTIQPAARVIINFPANMQVLQPVHTKAIDVEVTELTPSGKQTLPPGFNAPLPKVVMNVPQGQGLSPMAPQQSPDGKPADGQFRWGAPQPVVGTIDPKVK